MDVTTISRVLEEMAKVQRRTLSAFGKYSDILPCPPEERLFINEDIDFTDTVYY